MSKPSVTLSYPISPEIETTVETPLGKFSGIYLKAESAYFGTATINGKHTGVYVYNNVSIQNLSSHSFSIPVYYDVGTSGTSFYGTPVTTSISLLSRWAELKSNSLNILYQEGGGFPAGSTTIYSTTKWTDATLANVGCYASSTITVPTITTYRSDYADQPEIIGYRNSPAPNDTGGNTSVKLKVKRFYMCNKWECGGNTCGWGEKLEARYESNAPRIVIKGSLYRLSSSATIETFLDKLPIPETPTSTSISEGVMFKGPIRNVTKGVYRTIEYRFKNWNTKADGSGTTYGVGGKDLSKSGFTSNMSLYAQWESITSTTNKAPDTAENDQLERISSQPISTATLTCYDRSTIVDYHEARQYELKPMKLVRWRGNDNSIVQPGDTIGSADEYTAEFEVDLSGESQYEWENNVFTPRIPEQRPGWTYLGLAHSPDSVTGDYSGGAEITITQTQVLYAIWKANGAAKVFTETGGWKTYQIYIYNNDGEWKLYMPKIYTKENGWDNIYV